MSIELLYEKGIFVWTYPGRMYLMYKKEGLS